MSKRSGSASSAGALPGGRGTEEPDGSSTKRDRFELLYKILLSYHNDSRETALKVVGFLLLAMGWVVTSESARTFLAPDASLQWATIAVLSVAAVLFAMFAARVVRESQATFRSLEALDYMPVQYFQTMVVSPAVAAAFVVADLVITIVLCIFILRL